MIINLQKKKLDLLNTNFFENKIQLKNFTVKILPPKNIFQQKKNPNKKILKKNCS